jgi:hypothetical protein
LGKYDQREWWADRNFRVPCLLSTIYEGPKILGFEKTTENRHDDATPMESLHFKVSICPSLLRAKLALVRTSLPERRIGAKDAHDSYQICRARMPEWPL